MKNIKLIKKILTVVLGLTLMSVTDLRVVTAGQGDVDVYVVYSGKNKKDKSALKKVFPADISVKFYNIDLLALADYSGKQKALAKLDRAKLVLLIKDKPMELLEESIFNTKLLIVQSVKESVQSNRQILYVVSKGTELSGISGKTVTAANEADLTDIGDSKVVVIAEATLDIFKAVSIIAEKLIGA